VSVSGADITRRLADFAVGSTPPDAARRWSEALILELAAGAVAASSEPQVGSALAAVMGLGTPTQAGVLGRTERLSPIWAAYVNAVAASSIALASATTGAEAAGAVFPAALALAEWRRLEGSDLVVAVAVGVEIALRVGAGLGPGHRDRGWDQATTGGAVGAAAAAARLLGLDEQSSLMALGLAATQAGGFSIVRRRAGGATQAARAAANGVESALLAAAGFKSAPAAIEGRRGMSAVMSGAADLEPVVDALGRVWVGDSGSPAQDLTERARTLAAPALGSRTERFLELWGDPGEVSVAELVGAAVLPR